MLSGWKLVTAIFHEHRAQSIGRREAACQANGPWLASQALQKVGDSSSSCQLDAPIRGDAEGIPLAGRRAS